MQIDMRVQSATKEEPSPSGRHGFSVDSAVVVY